MTKSSESVKVGNVIKFYKVSQPYGFLSNFYRRPITFKGKVWPTSEHAYQAQKFERKSIQEEIRSVVTPHEAAAIGRNPSNPLRKDWEEVKDFMMLEIVRAKFHQCEDLSEKLLETGDSLLTENTKADSYWADAGDGTGKNMLGKILMQVRTEIKNERMGRAHG